MPTYFLSLLCLVSVGDSLEEVPLNPTSPRALLQKMHRQQLDLARRDIKFLGELIALDEELLRDLPDVVNGARAEKMREGIAELRAELAKTRRWERELSYWQDERAKNPGRETELRAIDAINKLRNELWGTPAPREETPKPLFGLCHGNGSVPRAVPS